MKIKDIFETTAGSIATVAMPMGKINRRPSLFGYVEEDLSTVPTMSVKELAAKHNTTVAKINTELKMGTKEEAEHTTDKAAAKEIALDHLKEDPKYYSKLKKMENVECD